MSESVPRPSLAKMGERAFWTAAVVSTLDLGTSAFPSVIDVFGPVPVVPLPIRALELALAAGALIFAYRGRALVLAFVDELRQLPIPRAGRAVLAAYLVAFFGHVLFRTETFPFSNVGMFSAVPRELDVATPRHQPGVVLLRARSARAFSPLREGSPLFAVFDDGWDYKLGWVMWMFGTSHSVALGEIDRLARAHGFERAARAELTIDPRTGRVLEVRPIGPRARLP